MTIIGVYHDTIVLPAAGSLTAGISVASTGDKAVYTPSMPIRIIRWGSIWDVAPTVTAPVLELDFRPTAGSDTNRVAGSVASGIDTAGGTITCPAIAGAGMTQGAGVFHNVNAGPLSASGPEGFVVFPGQQVVYKVATAATAGSGFFFMEYEYLAFQGDANTPGVGTQSLTVNGIKNLVKVAS